MRGAVADDKHQVGNRGQGGDIRDRGVGRGEVDQLTGHGGDVGQAAAQCGRDLHGDGERFGSTGENGGEVGGDQSGRGHFRRQGVVDDHVGGIAGTLIGDGDQVGHHGTGNRRGQRDFGNDQVGHRNDFDADGFGLGAERRGAAVDGGVDTGRSRDEVVRLVPCADGDGTGRAVEVGVGNKTNQGTAVQQHGEGRGNIVERVPGGAGVDRILPDTIGEVGGDDGHADRIEIEIGYRVHNVAGEDAPHRVAGVGEIVLEDIRQLHVAGIVQIRCHVYAEGDDIDPGGFDGGAERGGAAVNRGVDAGGAADEQTGLIPGAEDHGGGAGKPAVGDEPDQTILIKQHGVAVGHGSKGNPSGTGVDRILPCSVAIVGFDHGQPFERAGVGIGDAISTGAGDDHDHRIAGAVGVILQEAGEHHLSAVVEHGGGVGGNHGDRNIHVVRTEGGRTAGGGGVDTAQTVGAGRLIPGMHRNRGGTAEVGQRNKADE